MTNFCCLVYFTYPETSGVRLEDMNSIFGDATSTMPTPATQAEHSSLMGVGSPVPSLDIRQSPPLDGFPGFNIDPPSKSAESSKSQNPEDKPGDNRAGGWLRWMFQRGRGGNRGDTGRGVEYRRLDGEENE